MEYKDSLLTNNSTGKTLLKFDSLKIKNQIGLKYGYEKDYIESEKIEIFSEIIGNKLYVRPFKTTINDIIINHQTKISLNNNTIESHSQLEIPLSAINPKIQMLISGIAKKKKTKNSNSDTKIIQIKIHGNLSEPKYEIFEF